MERRSQQDPLKKKTLATEILQYNLSNNASKHVHLLPKSWICPRRAVNAPQAICILQYPAKMSEGWTPVLVHLQGP